MCAYLQLDSKKARVEGKQCHVKTMKSKKVVYYESMKLELKIKPIYECRCEKVWKLYFNCNWNKKAKAEG